MIEMRSFCARALLDASTSQPQPETRCDRLGSAADPPIPGVDTLYLRSLSLLSPCRSADVVLLPSLQNISLLISSRRPGLALDMAVNIGRGAGYSWEVTTSWVVYRG